jgi:hypothetical protein
VVRWVVGAGPSDKRLHVVALVRKTGFETVIHLKHAYAAYRVRALDAKGRVLGTSGPFPSRSSSAFNPGSH